MTPYCRDLLPLLKTSMDIQCVLGSYGAVVYTTDYMTKISKLMSNLLREYKKQCQENNLTLKEQLQEFKRVFMYGTEVSQKVMLPHFDLYLPAGLQGLADLVRDLQLVVID